MTVEIERPTYARMRDSFDFRNEVPDSPFVEVTLPMVPRIGEDLWWEDWHFTVTAVHWVDGCTSPSLRAK